MLTSRQRRSANRTMARSQGKVARPWMKYALEREATGFPLRFRTVADAQAFLDTGSLTGSVWPFIEEPKGKFNPNPDYVDLKLALTEVVIDRESL